MTTRVLAVDVGSTYIKAAVYDESLQPLRQARGDFPAIRDGGRAEADLDAVWEAFSSTVAGMEAPTMILSAQMAGLVLLDGDKKPVGPAILGVDRRVEDTAADSARTGCPPGGIYPANKLKWLSHHDPDRLARARFVGGIKEFLLHRLTGAWITDPSSASTTGLYDLSTQDWWPDAVSAAGIEIAHLPTIAPPEQRVGTSVLVGMGDGPAANLACGAVGNEKLCLSVGTTVVARLLVRGRRLPASPVPHFVQHVVDDQYCVGVRFDAVDETRYSPVGAPDIRVTLAEIPDIMRPLMSEYGATELRPIGSRCTDAEFLRQLESDWGLPVHAAGSFDGTRGVALVALRNGVIT